MIRDVPGRLDNKKPQLRRQPSQSHKADSPLSELLEAGAVVSQADFDVLSSYGRSSRVVERRTSGFGDLHDSTSMERGY